jgi:RimJ/RimL family protein N-acetyltransferase
MGKKKQKKTPAKMKPASWWITGETIGFGVQVLCCFDKQYPMPVGTVWSFSFGTDSGRVTDILDCFVPPPFRNQGVMTHMLRWLRERATLHTGQGRNKAAQTMMKKVGFRYVKSAGVWVAPQSPRK